MVRRLRVLSEHPHLGRPNDELVEFERAQAYVAAGFAEWIGERSAPIETTDATPVLNAGPVVVETTASRPGGRTARRKT